MGAALWLSIADPPAARALSGLPPPQPGCRYRIEVFDEGRAAWRMSPAEAMNDAVALDLASWDESRREFFLAVPVSMRVWKPECVK